MKQENASLKESEWVAGIVALSRPLPFPLALRLTD